VRQVSKRMRKEGQSGKGGKILVGAFVAGDKFWGDARVPFFREN